MAAERQAEMSKILTTRNRSLSQKWFARAQESLVEGVNSPSRGAVVYQPGPVVLERGQGARVWDVDGNEYIDFMMSFGALIQGQRLGEHLDAALRGAIGP